MPPEKIAFLSNLQEIPCPKEGMVCGVYFLVSGGEVVYVGQSVNVASRIGQHWDKEFDQVFVLPLLKKQLDRYEGMFIQEFQPRYNRNGRGRLIVPDPAMNFEDFVRARLRQDIENKTPKPIFRSGIDLESCEAEWEDADRKRLDPPRRNWAKRWARNLFDEVRRLRKMVSELEANNLSGGG